MTNTQAEVEAIDDEILKRYAGYGRLMGWSVGYYDRTLMLDVPGNSGAVRLQVFTKPNAELVCHQVDLLVIDMRRVTILLQFMNCWNDHTWFGNLVFNPDTGYVSWRYGLAINQRYGVTDGQVSKIAYTATEAVVSAMPALYLIRDTECDLETILIQMARQDGHLVN